MNLKIIRISSTIGTSNAISGVIAKPNNNNNKKTTKGHRHKVGAYYMLIYEYVAEEEV